MLEVYEKISEKKRLKKIEEERLAKELKEIRLQRQYLNASKVRKKSNSFTEIIRHWCKKRLGNNSNQRRSGK